MTSKDFTIILPDGVPLEMVYVEGGLLLMGTEELEGVQSVQEMEIDSFYLAKYPVTSEQFVPFLNEMENQEEGGVSWVDLDGGYLGVRCGIQQMKNNYCCIDGLEDHPMVCVSWYGSQAYCDWLSRQTGNTYRLPGEMEWAYAAKGGYHENQLNYSGTNRLKEAGWNESNSYSTIRPVGLKVPNSLGLHDMTGNVWEWCADTWHDNLLGGPTDGSPWTKGGDPNRRVVRGGSWYDGAHYSRVEHRFWGNVDSRNDLLGFRPALVLGQ